VLVRRDALGGELTAEPVGLFGENDATAEARGGERRGDATAATARN
jgi:hypothetical protein